MAETSMLNANHPRAQARRAGSTHYMGDAPCKVCGGRKRYTSNAACISCVKVATAQRNSDPEKLATIRAQAAERGRRFAERRKAVGLPLFAGGNPTANDLADFADILG